MPRAGRPANRHQEERHRLARLLSLFSVQKLAFHFESEEKTKDAIINSIVEDFATDEIVDFAYRYHLTTKHHVHLFEHSTTDLRRLPPDPLELPALARSETGTTRKWFYLIELPFTTYLTRHSRNQTGAMPS